jgi:hypothetical protein
MPTEVTVSHAQLVSALRTQVEETGTLDRTLRKGILVRGGGGPAVPDPYDALATRIAEDSYRVTDAQVQEVLEAAGSEKNAFEVILTAAIGSGLHRWDTAMKAIGEASDAPS